MTPGSETSEFTNTKFIMWAGLGLTVIGAILEGLTNAGLNFGFVPVVLAVIGPLMGLVKALGYTASRRDLKAAEVASKGAVEVAHILPLLKEVRDLVQEARKPPGAPELPGGTQ